MLSDAQRHPFSLFIEAKTKQHQNLLHPESLHHQLSVRIERVGDVVDVMDKAIGRPAIRIKGAVSAKNYIDFDGLHLTGRYVHVQLCLIKSIATFHIELIMSNDMPLRISLSTLYSSEQPRFLGASLRIPLPLQEDQWSIVLLDMDEIINRYCSGSSNGHSGGVNSSRYLDGSPALKLKSIRRIQLCSNMVVRDVVVSDKALNGIVTPKELAIRAHGDVEMRWIDIIGLYPNVGRTPDVDASKLLKNPNRILHSAKEAASPSHYDPQKSVYDPDKSHFSPASKAASAIKQQENLLHDDNNINSDAFSVGSQSPTNRIPGAAASRRPLKMDGNAYPRSPLSGSYLVPDRFLSGLGGAAVEEEEALALQLAHSEEELRDMEQDIQRLKEMDTYISAKELAAQAHGGRGDGISTPRSDNRRAKGTGSTPAGSIVRPAVPETNPSDRVMVLDKILGYGGGPSLLLYDGKMGVLACGSLVVLVDIAGSAGADKAEPQGLWKAFRSTAPSGDAKHRQAFLRGHTSPVGILEVSHNFHYMISSETAANGTLLVWDLTEGKKVITLKPHPDSIICAALSPDNSILVTVGTDLQRRVQIIAWDFRLLLLEKGVVLPLPFIATISTTQGFNLNPNGSGGLVMARQLSDFHISKIAFSPFDDCGLVSAGRENIRFWRMRKGHLPGRPTQLNEFGRGFSFSDIAFYAEPGATPKDPRRPCVYVASNKGLLMKICCIKEQLLCTYQLHNGPIRSLALRSGYAVTGGDDSRLRVWPLDFSDFLLEAHHEKSVTSISIAKDGRKLIVGTTFGTLGVLDVSEHSYNTVLRSHVGPVVAVAARGADARAVPEFATLGADCTIRVWDLKSLQQKFEFSSPSDAPLCAAYHPDEHSLACGFESGWLRVFDVPATTTLLERRQHIGAVRAVAYTKVGDAINLFTASMDGTIVVYDVTNDYSPVKTMVTLPLSGHPADTVRLAVSKDNKLVASSTAFISSVTVYDTQELAVVHRAGTSAAATDAAAAAEGAAQGESPMRRRSSPAAEALLSSSFSAAVDALTLSGSLQIPLTGLVFNDTPSGAASLFVSTDKHIISLPLDRCGKRGSSKWSDKLMRRVDFGVPRSMTRDPHSGVLFLSVTAPQKSGAGGTPVGEKADSVVVVDARLRVGPQDRLKLSAAQMFQSHSTSITDICASFASHGKVLSIDELGSVTVWSVLKDRVDRLQTEGFSPERESPAPASASAAEKAAQLADTRGLIAESNAAAMDIANEPSPAAVAVAAPVIMARKIEQKKVTGLARDFDAALNEEGRFEISSTSNTVINTAYSNSVSILATDTKSPAVVKSGSYDGAPAKKTRSASITQRDLSSVRLAKSPGPKVPGAALAPRVAVKSAWEEVAAGPGGSAAAAAVPEVIVQEEEQVEETIFDFDLDESFEDMHDLETDGHRFARKINVLCIKNKVSPNICLPQRKFLVSNGSSIVIKSIDGGYDEILHRPLDAPTDMDTVVASSLSPSGYFAAAVVSTKQQALPATDRSGGLFTDVSSNALALSPIFQLMVWVQDRVTSGQWRFVGGASLVVPAGSKTPVFLDWLADDSLVIAAMATTNANISDGVILSLLPPDKLLSGQLASNLRSQSQKLAYRGDLQGLRLLPGQDRSEPSRGVLAVMHSGPKIYLARFNTLSTLGDSSAAVVWSDDIGKRGPFTAIDAAVATGRVPDNASSLILTLDSFCGIRLYILYGGSVQPTPVDVSLPTHYTASSPRTLCLSPGARGGVSDSPSVVIGYTSSVLLYSLLFNQKPGRAITGALQQMYKVSLNFAPEYLIPLQRRLSEQPDVLVANSSGLIGYIACSDGGSRSGERDMETIHSPPLPRSPDTMVVCPDTDVLVSVSKGVVSLCDTTSGIQLPMPSPGINNATCLAACSAFFAVGSKCGRISIYNTADMQILRTIVNNFSDAKAEAKPSRSRAAIKAPAAKAADSKAVNSILFMCSEDIIVSAYEDGTVAATIINGGGHCKLAYKQLNPSLSGVLRLVPCAQDDTVFGVLRGGGSLEVYRLTVATTRDRNHVSLLPNIYPVISKASLVTIETVLQRAEPALRGGGSVAFDKPLQCSSVHLIKSSKYLLVSAIAADSSSKRAVLLCGAVDMTTIKDATSVTSVRMHPRLSLCKTRCPGGASVSFAGSVCAVATSAGVCIINVLHAADAVAALSHTSNQLAKPLTLEEAATITSVPFVACSSAVVEAQAASWACSALALAHAPSEEGREGHARRRLFAYKSFGSSLFKVDL